MNVKLVGMTRLNGNGGNPLDVVYTAMSQCYNERFDLEDSVILPDEKKSKLIKNVIKSGHESFTEMVSFDFLIEDVSRVLTHQLCRHRLASFAQRSARYTGLEENWFVIPPEIEKNPEAKEIYLNTMTTTREAYDKLQKLGIKKEDCRFCIPNGQKSNIFVTMNCRVLKNFFGLRLCTRAQWEIRELAEKMSIICRSYLPAIFEDCKWGYSKCIQDGFCKEKSSCGRMKTLAQLMGE